MARESSSVEDDPTSLHAATSHLRHSNFIVLTHNPGNVPDAQFEAWAYVGPLDFNVASPIRFGLGADPVHALHALNDQLKDASS